MTFTNEDAVRIAKGIDPDYDYQIDDAYFPVSLEEFTKALNLAAAEALEQHSDYGTPWLKTLANEYRAAAQGGNEG